MLKYYSDTSLFPIHKNENLSLFPSHQFRFYTNHILQENQRNTTQLAYDFKNKRRVIVKKFPSTSQHLFNFIYNNYMSIDKEVFCNLERRHITHCPYLYSIDQDQNRYIFYNYIEGNDLITKINQHVFDRYQIKRIIKQLCYMLSLIHHFNIIHHDIKPDNILINNNDVNIIDWDFVECLDEQGYINHFCGTINYLPLEFFHRRGKILGKPIDIWGLGVIFYMMLTQSYPYPFSDNWKQYKKTLLSKKNNTGILDYPKKFTSPEGKILIFHPYLQDLLDKIFVFDPSVRINSSQIPLHPWIQNNYSIFI